MILLDTQALIWWVSDPSLLSTKAAQTIEQERTESKLLVSSISVWEIYMLVAKDRLKLNCDTDAWITNIEAISCVQFVPISNRIAGRSVMLDNFHADPADRMIVATAREYGVVIVTKDQKIRDYKNVRSVW
ncbi:MAG: ribonuclease VapC [Patescibacteria group bacterium]|nr:MAG: ribonuclease VapC [Patescibacteria group bacterium]